MEKLVGLDVWSMVMYPKREGKLLEQDGQLCWAAFTEHVCEQFSRICGVCT